MDYTGVPLSKAKQQLEAQGKKVKIINNFKQSSPKNLLVTNSKEEGDNVTLVVGSFDLDITGEK